MSDTDFQKLADLYGFAPSRALRELLDAAQRLEREACARLVDHILREGGGTYGTAIRARRNT